MGAGIDNPEAAAWLDGEKNNYKPHGLSRSDKQPQQEDKYADGTIHKFRYVGHNTTRNHSAALNFVFVEDDEKEATAFYNVDLLKKDGSTYKVGYNGQFNVKKGSKFRKLYKKITGKEKPKNGWSRVAETLKREFKDVVFTVEI